MLRKFIRYILIALGTVIFTVAAVIAFFTIQGHMDGTSSTEVVGGLTLKSGWIIEERVTITDGGSPLASGSGMEVVARNTNSGEQITLLTGPDIALGMYSDEQGRPVISIPKLSNGFQIKIEHDSLRGIPVIYNFTP